MHEYQQISPRSTASRDPLIFTAVGLHISAPAFNLFPSLLTRSREPSTPSPPSVHGSVVSVKFPSPLPLPVQFTTLLLPALPFTILLDPLINPNSANKLEQTPITYTSPHQLRPNIPALLLQASPCRLMPSRSLCEPQSALCWPCSANSGRDFPRPDVVKSRPCCRAMY